MSCDNVMELLAPAGNIENLKVAVSAGANAVYLGLNEFSARAKAIEFNISNLGYWVRYCHIYGVKVYLTLNTIIKQNEVKRAINIAKLAIDCGVDAIILQDVGFAYIMSQELKEAVMHASTQMGVHNAYGAIFCSKLGLDRVILSRESTLEDIKDIRQKANVEIEVFVQGAMCVAFSGNCLYSSVISLYSGNRGKCMQLCRKDYEQNIKSLNKKPLNASELCLAGDLKTLASSGVSSIKIEGRLRQANYVHFAVDKYRRIIDNSYNVTRDDLQQLSSFFDRGGVTNAHLYNATNNTIIKTPKNGSFYKSHNEYTPKDKKLPVDIIVDQIDNSNLKLSYTYNDITVSHVDCIVSEAINTPTPNDKIIDVVSKLGDSVFSVKSLHTNIKNNSFVSLKALNKLRKDSVIELENNILSNYIVASKNNKIDAMLATNIKQFAMPKVLIQVDSIDKIEVVSQYADGICFNPPSYDIASLESFVSKTNNSFINVPMIARSKDLELILKIQNSESIKGVIVNNVFGLEVFKEKNIICGQGLNGVNDLLPYKKILSIEAYDITKYDDYLCVYSTLPLMHFCHCPLKSNTSISCDTCEFVKLQLIDDHNKAYSIRKYKLAYCYHQMLNSVALDLTNLDLKRYKYLFYDFTATNIDKIKQILQGNSSKYYTHAGYKKGVK